MGKNSKKASVTANPSPASTPAVAPMPGPAPIAPFSQRHPTASKLIFAAVWIYVSMLWLLALDQTFHWGIWGPQGFFLWNSAAHGVGP